MLQDLHSPDAEKLKNHPDYIAAANYSPEKAGIEIPLETAREEIATNFPELAIESIAPFGESMGNAAFLVNNEILFRIPRHAKATGPLQMETAMLSKIQKVVSLPVPNFTYVDRTAADLPFVGYTLIPGDALGKKELLGPDGTFKPHLLKQIAQFFDQLHSMDADEAKRGGVRKRDLRAHYMGERKRNREILYPVLRTDHPEVAEQFETHFESTFSKYLDNPEYGNFTSVLCHGDLESEHIRYSSDKDEITGVIDFGGLSLTDPDYDLWRPYYHYGKEFIENLLQFYPHENPEFLFEKMRLYMDMQIAHRMTRGILRQTGISRTAIERLKSHIAS